MIKIKLVKLHTTAFNNVTVCAITICVFTNTNKLSHTEFSFGFNNRKTHWSF